MCKSPSTELAGQVVCHPTRGNYFSNIIFLATVTAPTVRR